MVQILLFPSSRQSRAVCVMREPGDLGGWLTLVDACDWLHGSWADAMADAREIAKETNLTIESSAGRIAL
jgi:hypothetical protein